MNGQAVEGAGAPPYRKIRFVSYIAALTVLYWHAGNWVQFGQGETSAAYSFEWSVISLCKWAVPFFFAASGYLFFHGFTMDKLLPKWKRRIKSLLVPYLIWNALYYLYYAVFLRIPFVQRVLMTEPVELSFSAALSGVFLHSCLGVMWYVELLMVFVLLAPVFYTLLRQRVLGGVCVLALFLLTAFSAPFPFSFAQMSWESLFFYAAGAYLGLCFPGLCARNVPRPPRAAALAGLIALIAFSAFVAMPSVYSALFIPLLWCAVDGARVRERFVYGTSFFLYASHMMLMQAPEKLQQLILPKTGSGAVAAYLTSPILTAALVLGLAYGMNRFAPRIYALLCGGRGGERLKQLAIEQN